MIKCEQLFEIFKKYGFIFFTGIPDSTYKGWMSFLDEYNKSEKLTNRIAVNECEAIAISCGYHLATGKIGIVYMQNAGLGKTVNPITSIADPEVYSIPILLMIGWRGEPGIKDEPQHKKMGRITLNLLDTLEIPYKILPDSIEEIEKIISEAKEYMLSKNAPYAVIIKKKLIDEYKVSKEERKYDMLREDAIKTIIDNLDKDYAIVSTTGKTSRELFEYREALKQKHDYDFLNVGGMGCASSEALEIAMQQKKKIFIFDGDGAILMQLGSLATIGHYQPNLCHIVFDNNAHESTGGQKTISNTVNFAQIALNAGYKEAYIVETRNELINKISEIKLKKGPIMLIIKVDKGARKDLGRPTTTPIENKEKFMAHLK